MGNFGHKIFKVVGRQINASLKEAMVATALVRAYCRIVGQMFLDVRIRSIRIRRDFIRVREEIIHIQVFVGKHQHAL